MAPAEEGGSGVLENISFLLKSKYFWGQIYIKGQTSPHQNAEPFQKGVKTLLALPSLLSSFCLRKNLIAMIKNPAPPLATSYRKLLLIFFFFCYFLINVISQALRPARNALPFSFVDFQLLRQTPDPPVWSSFGERRFNEGELANGLSSIQSETKQLACDGGEGGG